jgi:hypothetical protein
LPETIFGLILWQLKKSPFSKGRFWATLENRKSGASSASFGPIFLFYPSLEPYFHGDHENKIKKLDNPKSNSPLALNGFLCTFGKWPKKDLTQRLGPMVMLYKKVL